MAPIRTMRPVYVDRLPPCNHGCPAGEDVQAWLSEAQAGRYREAWDIIVRDNPIPAVHGRVCITHARTHATVRTSTQRSASMQ
jgi:formate dehydrogenase beta subunit